MKMSSLAASWVATCSCKAKDTHLCSRWCGVHNISHPFRLKDSPDTCGDHSYTLSCEDNQLMLYLEYGKYNVQSINYNNYTIRAVDVNLQQLHNSSLPTYSLNLTISNLSYAWPYQVSMGLLGKRLIKSMLFVNCPNGVEFSGVYVDDSATCMNSSKVVGNSFNYINVDGKYLWNLGLPDSCRIEFMYLTSWPHEIGKGNASCGDVHDMLLYGFELSWMNSLCKYGLFARMLYPPCVPPEVLQFASFLLIALARGTIGYMAPELFDRIIGTISYKADVYSFGMLLVEMASRRKNLNALAEQSSQIYFPFWIYDQSHDGKEITIENDTDEEMKLAKKMMIVALWCIQTRTGDRPPMDKVLETLEEDEELQMPNKPYLYPQDIPTDNVRDHSSSGPSSDTSMSNSKE